MSTGQPAPVTKALSSSDPRSGFLALEAALLMFAAGIGVESLYLNMLFFQLAIPSYEAGRLIEVMISIAGAVVWISSLLIVFGLWWLRGTLASDVLFAGRIRRAWLCLIAGTVLSAGAVVMWFVVLSPGSAIIWPFLFLSQNPEPVSVVTARLLGTASGALFLSGLALPALARSRGRNRRLVQTGFMLGVIAVAAEVPLAFIVGYAYNPPGSILTTTFPPWSWGILVDPLVVASALALGWAYRGLAGARPERRPIVDESSPSV